MMVDPPVRAAVVLASAGRSTLLAEAIKGCRAQQGARFRGVVSTPDEGSLPADGSLLAGWEVVTGVRGLAAQRNAGLERLGAEDDIVFFFDDDALVRSDYISQALAFFERHPEVVGITGRVLADGKITGEIDLPTANSTLELSWSDERNGRWRRTRELYGANFAIRRSVAPSLQFDERLPLYSWLEDHDFARRLMRYGALARLDDCVIVHRAASSGGRANHLRLGYSQVMNPVHLVRKGSFPLWLCAQQIMRPLTKNVVLSLFGSSPHRRQRLRGNVIALGDLLKGRVTPERITTMAQESKEDIRAIGTPATGPAAQKKDQ